MNSSIQKPKLHDEHAVGFGGPLEFVNTLSEIILSGGFADPPIIKPRFTDLRGGYDLKLPNVGVGIFALRNMKIGALLTIPFTGDQVALRFFFSTREAPFLLTVSLFGGGSFFALVTTGDGIQEVEAAFEFGAFVAFDVGVASGGVDVKKGVYFHWKTDAVTLEGYVEMDGELSVLGLVSVSIVMHLALGYYKDAPESFVRGQATLTIEVEVLFLLNHPKDPGRTPRTKSRSRPRTESASPAISGCSATTDCCAATRRCWPTSSVCSAASSRTRPLRPTLQRRLREHPQGQAARQASADPERQPRLRLRGVPAGRRHQHPRRHPGRGRRLHEQLRTAYAAARVRGRRRQVV